MGWSETAWSSRDWQFQALPLSGVEAPGLDSWSPELPCDKISPVNYPGGKTTWKGLKGLIGEGRGLVPPSLPTGP